MPRCGASSAWEAADRLYRRRGEASLARGEVIPFHGASTRSITFSRTAKAILRVRIRESVKTNNRIARKN